MSGTRTNGQLSTEEELVMDEELQELPPVFPEKTRLPTVRTGAAGVVPPTVKADAVEWKRTRPVSVLSTWDNSEVDR